MLAAGSAASGASDGYSSASYGYEDDGKTLVATVAAGQTATLADGETVFYIEISEEIISTSGHLLSSCSTDGYHLTTEAYKNWAKLIGVQLGKLEID